MNVISVGSAGQTANTAATEQKTSTTQKVDDSTEVVKPVATLEEDKVTLSGEAQTLGNPNWPTPPNQQ